MKNVHITYSEMIFRPYQNGDEVAIKHLFSQCFGREITQSFWRWRFLEQPQNEILIYLAWDDKILAGHYAVSSVILSIEGSDCLTGLSMTTMTHPKYRGLKLFPQLAKQLYNKMISMNYLIVWGFPNNKSHKSFVRDLLWENIYEIPTMQMKIYADEKRDIDDIETDDHFYLNYRNNFFSVKLTHVKKDKRYLQWRYSAHPKNHYTNIVIAKEKEVSSFCIVKKYLNSLDIIDFQSTDQEEGRILMRQVQSFAQANKLDFINCWAPRHHFLHSICEENGFINKEPITYLGFRQLCDDKLIKVSNNYVDWFLQMGDSDVY